MNLVEKVLGKNKVSIHVAVDDIKIIILLYNYNYKKHVLVTKNH